MPCSCRARKNNTVSIKKDSNIAKVNYRSFTKAEQIQPSIQSIIQIVSDSHSQSLSQDYDYSSTTKPTELCYNCIRKHLSIAYTLLQESDSNTFLIALGEILCASLHLITTNKELHNAMRNRVLQTMRGNKDLLLEDLFKWIQDIQHSIDKPDLIQPSPQQANLIGLMTVYGLLFVQVSYQEINKSWATAELFKGAIKKFRQDRNIQDYQNVRKIWKLIQDMKPYDRTYEDAQKALREEILKQWHHYKENKG